ncbi:sigma-70 family RNA polymerase sigma factor [Roseiconus nitratireducens]|uniref:Sigma-70 family RNA polymerase sigma factor n=1 Tax=Roseiconus nitratireducens TaxID=2605748 RepID=A0A5M6DAG6_9BACT|nr:sigma-70 family RNA polymerase sigma factor [Roseiconus nitratireducens]KAA5544548.1 sigma-70 family RNA polymerase sigma factor [Roseiconus nitratireducens]
MTVDANFNAQIRHAARQIACRRQADDQTLALAGLYDLTADRLVRFSVSITRRQHDAEDAVSAALVKIVAQPKLLIGADRPWHYLLQMVRNESLVILRTRSRWSSIGSLAERLIGRNNNPVDLRDRNRQVWDAMSDLPAAQRQVVVLKIWEQMTFAEIAEVLQITPSTAASRYRYALEKLARKLQPAGQEAADTFDEVGREVMQ